MATVIDFATGQRMPRSQRGQHVEWLREYFRGRNIFNDTNFEIEEEEAFSEELDRLKRLVLSTPARAPEACIAQLLILADMCMSSELPLETLRPPIHAALKMLEIDTWRESV